MAKKRKAWLHIGVPGAGDVITRALTDHHFRLVELGVASVARTDDECRRAAADLQGYFLLLARRAAAANVDIAFSHSSLASATTEQVAALALALADFKVHVVVTTGDQADQGDKADQGDRQDTDTALDPALDTWRLACRKPERLHVLDTTGLSCAEVWRAFGRTAGFGTASLGLSRAAHQGCACQHGESASPMLATRAR